MIETHFGSIGITAYRISTNCHTLPSVTLGFISGLAFTSHGPVVSCTMLPFSSFPEHSLVDVYSEYDHIILGIDHCRNRLIQIT